jgi:hypothetical protein
VHEATFVARSTANGIASFRVSVYRRCFDLKCCRFIHTVPMDDMYYLKAIAADVSNSLTLVGQNVGIWAKLALDMRKNAVSDTLADIERLTVARVD